MVVAWGRTLIDALGWTLVTSPVVSLVREARSELLLTQESVTWFPGVT